MSIKRKAAKKHAKKVAVRKELPTFKGVRSFFKAYEAGRLPRSTAIRYDCGAFFFECCVGKIDSGDYDVHNFLVLDSIEGELEFFRYLFSRAGIRIKIGED
jgi:hypothetical protein